MSERLGDVFRSTKPGKSSNDLLIREFAKIACAYCAILELYGGNALYVTGDITFAQALVCRVTMLVSSCAFLFVFRYALRYFSKRVNRALHYSMAIFGLLPVVSAVFVDCCGFSWWLIILWVLAGIPSAHVYIEITACLARCDRGKTLPFFALAIAAASVGFLVMELCIAPVPLVIFSLIIIAATLLCGINLMDFDHARDLASSNRRYSRTPLDAILYTFVSAVAMGAGAFFLFQTFYEAGFTLGAPLCFGGAVLLAAAALLVDHKTLKAITEEKTARYLYLLIAIPLTCAVVFPVHVMLAVSGVAMMATMWVVALVGGSAEIESAQEMDYPPELTTTLSWALNVLGYAIGILACVACWAMTGVYPHAFETAVLVAVVVLAAVVTYSMSSRAPKSVLMIPSPSTSEEPKQRYRDILNSMADAAKLSAREREVFFYLARGRNSKYIQQELVISRGTADTHIYNIYRKMGVHTHQEMLDLLDVSFDNARGKSNERNQ